MVTQRCFKNHGGDNLMSFPDLYIDFFMAAPRGSTMYVRVMSSLYTKKMLTINYVSVPTYVVSAL